MKKYLSVPLVFFLLCISAGCRPPAAGPTPHSGSGPLFTRESYPRVDGSTVTLPLSVDLAAELMQISIAEAQLFIVHNKTHQAYLNLLQGAADIIFVTEPSEDELALAAQNEIELEVVPVVRDAFVFVANKQNPVDSLTAAQIQAIYQGLITSWREVGGEDKEIIAYQRPRNSGSQTLMEGLVMRGLTMVQPPVEHMPAGMGDLIERVSGYENADRALGYSVYYYAHSMYNRETMKFLAVNGVKPEKITIAGETYPFTIAYYAVLRQSEPAGSPARILLEWLLSDSGQELAEQSGYVPLR
jgi:phosphate transport system substrate-binding protein